MEGQALFTMKRILNTSMLFPDSMVHTNYYPVACIFKYEHVISRLRFFTLILLRGIMAVIYGRRKLRFNAVPNGGAYFAGLYKKEKNANIRHHTVV